MNDAPIHEFTGLKSLLRAETWFALLAMASHRLWERHLPAAIPLWVIPGDSGVDSSTLPHGEAICEVLSRYATVLDVPMSFHTAADRYSRPAPGDAVHIHAFALPTPAILFGCWPRVPLAPLPFAHGIPLREGAHRAMGPGPQIGRGRLLLDEDGRAVGETLGTNLYCLFDLLGQDAAWVPLLLRRQVDRALPHLLPALRRPASAAAQPWADRLRLLRDETGAMGRALGLARRQEARTAYLSACQAHVAEEVRFLESEIAFLEEAVEEMARRIAADTRRLKEGRRRWHLLQGWPDRSESPGEELEGIQRLPDVREAHLQDGRISVTTSPIPVAYEGRWYRLGTFRLDLYFSGEVRITNLTQRVGRYDHPHVHQGRPCLGSSREGIAKLIGEFQFVAATEVLVDFLKTVSPADWHLAVWHWPEAGHEAACGALAST